jgi:hypothetical protein
MDSCVSPNKITLPALLAHHQAQTFAHRQAETGSNAAASFTNCIHTRERAHDSPARVSHPRNPLRETSQSALVMIVFMGSHHRRDVDDHPCDAHSLLHLPSSALSSSSRGGPITGPVTPESRLQTTTPSRGLSPSTLASHSADGNARQLPPRRRETRAAACHNPWQSPRIGRRHRVDDQNLNSEHRRSRSLRHRRRPEMHPTSGRPPSHSKTLMCRPHTKSLKLTLTLGPSPSHAAQMSRVADPNRCKILAWQIRVNLCECPPLRTAPAYPGPQTKSLKATFTLGPSQR